jgi:hypothetical protein
MTLWLKLPLPSRHKFHKKDEGEKPSKTEAKSDRPAVAPNYETSARNTAQEQNKLCRRIPCVRPPRARLVKGISSQMCSTKS